MRLHSYIVNTSNMRARQVKDTADVIGLTWPHELLAICTHTRRIGDT